MGDVADWLERHQKWSRTTFGPGTRVQGKLAHIRKELEEIEADPTDLIEWIDVAILAFDGAWRVGYLPEEIETAFWDKLHANMKREWPDWRGRPYDEPIEHIRDPA